MTILQVPDMHCENCVRRITEALTREGLAFRVDLAGKTVAVDGDQQAVATAVEALDDLGFDAME
ncbi:MAG: heavy-metal-associated domain-containing protein [Clostridiales bacterium]|nr:heavy-metal-associated domain-containing protein [Clostridiales bacterium]